MKRPRKALFREAAIVLFFYGLIIVGIFALRFYVVTCAP